MNEEYKALLAEIRTMGSRVNDYAVRQVFSEKMSQYMNIQEKRNACSVIECITNTAMNDSFIVYAQ